MGFLGAVVATPGSAFAYLKSRHLLAAESTNPPVI